MNIRFHSFQVRNIWNWDPLKNKQLAPALKNSADDVHVFIDAPINHATAYKLHNYNTREDIQKAFDIVWESPTCINNSYSLTEPRNIVLVCKVKKEFQ